jgi:hypothetical protein
MERRRREEIQTDEFVRRFMKRERMGQRNE